MVLKASGINDVGVSYVLEMEGDDSIHFAELHDAIRHVAPPKPKRYLEHVVQKEPGWIGRRRIRFFTKTRTVKLKHYKQPKPPKIIKNVAKAKRWVISGYNTEADFIQTLKLRGYTEETIQWELEDLRMQKGAILDLWLYQQERL